MPRLRIWNTGQIALYEKPPVFSSSEQDYFLKLPESLQTHWDASRNLSHKIGFQLSFAYFFAAKRFYPPEYFHMEDIRYLCRRMGVFSLTFDPKQYKGSTYSRHRKMILEHFAFQSFDLSKQRLKLTEAISQQIASYEKPALILNFILEWLEWRRIELPSYHSLQLIITDAIRKRNRQLGQKLENLLTDSHKALLDTLVEEQIIQGKSLYLISHLRSLSPLYSPKQIRKNIEILKQVGSFYDQIQTVIEKLELSDQAIRFFGELVLGYEIFQLRRRKDPDRYLLLISFIAYQLKVFQDWMTDTYLTVCQQFLGKAKRTEQDDLFINRREHRKAFKKVSFIALNALKILKTVYRLIWTDKKELSASKKIDQLQQLLPQEGSSDQQTEVQNIQDKHHLKGQDRSYHYLKVQSQALQIRLTPIVKTLRFQAASSEKNIFEALEYFQKKQANIDHQAPVSFLEEQDQLALYDQKGKFRVSLYKILFFRELSKSLKSGQLNLRYSYKYKPLDQYLIPLKQWEKDKDQFLEKANLLHLKQFKPRCEDFQQMIAHHFTKTNTQILEKKNLYFRRSKKGKYRIITPKTEKEKKEIGLFPPEASIPLSEILSTIDQATGFLDAFSHYNPHYRKQKPHRTIFYAALTAFGCNHGIAAMAQATPAITAAQLENAANWYLDLANIEKAHERIVNFMDKLPLPNLFRKHENQLRTTSDGQKIKVASKHSIFASHSFKYFDRASGVSAYAFMDERYIPFYSTIINAQDREAIYVLDGLLHNDAIKSTIHVTDTHGFSEAVFACLDLLGFGFSPTLARLFKQKLYSFEKKREYQNKNFPILPHGYVQENKIEQAWDQMLRFVTSLKLKYCTPSQAFKRLNSYSRQHPIYAALKEYGRMPKTVHILRYINELELRQGNRELRNDAELNNRCSNAIFFANGGEMIFLTRKEQLIAEAAKSLIKSAIICWNYLFLTREIQKAKEQKQQILNNILNATPMAWRHIHFSGKYDFSDASIQDSRSLLNSLDFELGVSKS